MYVQRNAETRSCNRCCKKKAISITYSECVSVALGIQRVLRVHHIIVCGLPDCTFPHYRISATISGKRTLLNIKCVFGFRLQLLSETFLC